MIDWNIQSRSHTCQGCGRGFRDQEPLHTLLFDERQGYQRQDVCEACWTSQYSQGANHRKGFVSHWQGAYCAPPALAPEPIQRDTAETLLRKLVELNSPEHAGACFILAVMLERKRLLKVKAQNTEGGQRVSIYEHAKTGDVFMIPDPNLHLDQLEAVQHDVAHLLEHGLPPLGVPASAGETVPAADAPETSNAQPPGGGTPNLPPFGVPASAGETVPAADAPETSNAQPPEGGTPNLPPFGVPASAGETVPAADAPETPNAQPPEGGTPNPPPFGVPASAGETAPAADAPETPNAQPPEGGTPNPPAGG